MFAKFDENGKILSYADVKNLEDIRPDYEGFEEIKAFSETDIWYLVKKNGVVQVDEETKAADQKKAENAALNAKYIPSESDSLKAFIKLYFQTASIKDDDVKLSISGICDEWKPGNHVKGELVNISGQTWECYTAHDNSVYPDIIPDKPQTWANFWRPLHGKTKETARPWTKPIAGTTDMYHVGEYMIYTDNKVYKCLRDTVYSPEEYAPDWEDVA